MKQRFNIVQIIFPFFLIIFAFGLVAVPMHASALTLTVNVPDSGSSWFDLSAISQNLTNLVDGFVSTGQQIEGSLLAQFSNVDTWFSGTTGMHLIQIVKPVGNLVADVLTFFANLIRQGVTRL